MSWQVSDAWTTCRQARRLWTASRSSYRFTRSAVSAF